MDQKISLVDIMVILAVTVFLILLFIPKKKGYAYTSLDKTGVILNIILSVIYVPLSVAGICTIFFWDVPPTDYSALKIFLLEAITWIGISVPFLSIASIFTSVIARKRGKSKLSFIIQFLPVFAFAVIFLFMLCMAGT